MLVSAAEPIPPTTSNSFFAFVFCNLIVLLIFLGPRFESGDSKTRDALPAFVRSSRHAKQREEKLAIAKATEVCDVEINREEEQEDNIGECEDEEGKEEDDNEDENEDNGEEEANDHGDDNGDDELRRRIENFIAKVNRDWKEENSKERIRPLTTLDEPLDFKGRNATSANAQA